MTEKNKRLILKTLRDMGAKKVTVEYSGSGDSGQFDGCVIDDDKAIDVEVEAWEKRGHFVAGRGFVDESVVVKKKITEVIIDYCDTILESLHGGCFNNEGADGQFDIDVDTGDVVLTHNEHYLSSNTTETPMSLADVLDEISDSVSRGEQET